MKLEYKVWWFDDQPQHIRSAVDGINDRLARKGFKLQVKPIDRVGDVGSLLCELELLDKPDLIMMDWHLNDKQNGAVIAKAIRRRFQYTEIVFYSAATTKELRKAIFDQDIDGVYCANRDTLIADSIGVIDTTIKKAVDLNHMRGITMAYVSELDNKMLDSIRECHSLLDEKGKALLVKTMKGYILSINKAEIKKVETKLTENAFEELLGFFSFSTSVRFRTLNKLIKDDNPEHNHLLEKMLNYCDEVIKPRNELAHVCEQLIGDKVVLQCDGAEYDEGRLMQLRQELLAHSDNFDDILNSLKAGRLTPRISK